MTTEQLICKLYEINKDVIFTASDISLGVHESILIEPYKYDDKKLDGMQIIYTKEGGVSTFEVSEIQAKGTLDMYIYGEYKTLKGAMTSLMKGNADQCRRKPIEILEG